MSDIRIPNVWELKSLTIKHEFNDKGYIKIYLYITDETIPIYIATTWDKLWGFIAACRILYGQYCGFEVEVIHE